jgi:exopolyphosphatase/pppGpp-phosphohydrolase
MMDRVPPPEHLEAVLKLAQTCEYELTHSHQVTRLALRLFDELEPLHHLGKSERDLLHYAGILHDIGWVEGWKEHHKVALRIILTTQLLPFSNKERLLVGSIARYHRKAMPNISHDHFAALSVPERKTVEILSGILRLADGLDHAHQNRVRDVTSHVTARKITIRCHSFYVNSEEQAVAAEKCQLLERALDRKVILDWVPLNGA